MPFFHLLKSILLCLIIALGLADRALSAELLSSPWPFTSSLEYQEEPLQPPAVAGDFSRVLSKLGDWRPLPGSDGNLGFHSQALWFRLKIPADRLAPEGNVLVFSYAPLDSIDIYIETGEQSFRHWAVGDQYPFSQRSYPYRLANIALPEASAELTVYFRVKTASSFQVGGFLYSEQAFLQQQSLELMGLGIYYGGLFILVVYNLFLYFSLRESIYLNYVLYVINFFIFQAALNGTLYQYLLADYPQLCNLLLPVSSSTFAFFLARFTISFLGLSTQSYFDRSFRAFTWLQLVFAVIAIVAPYHLSVKVTVFVGITFPLLAIYAALRQVKRKHEEAANFAIAFFFFLFFAGLYALKTLALIPSFFLTEYSLQIGSLGEATLLSIALAHRIHRLKNSVMHLNQELQKEINEKTSVYQELKRTVEEHTHLQEQTAIMTFHLEGVRYELTAATQRLIQADKLATLGIMSAGIAHDIASPSNVITLNQNHLLGCIKKIKDEVLELLHDEQDPDVLIIRNDFLQHFSEVEESLNSNDLAIKRIGDISRAVRNVARADLDPTSFSLCELIRETLLIIRSRAANIQFEFDQAKDVHIHANRSQIGQIFMNLFVNAADSINSSGNSERRILIEWEQDQSFTHICVHDSGTGLAPDVLKKMGEAFFTTKPKDKGTGLGMSIIQRILAHHDSRLEIGNSSLLCGARMKIWLKSPESR